MTRTKRRTLTFSRAFKLESVERSFPAGAYELVMDEELIEGLSFPVYRRVASWILAAAQNSRNATELIMIDPAEFTAAHGRDAACTN